MEEITNIPTRESTVVLENLSRATVDYTRWVLIFVGALGSSAESAAEQDTLWIVKRLFNIVQGIEKWRVEAEVLELDRWLFSDQIEPFDSARITGAQWYHSLERLNRRLANRQGIQQGGQEED